MASNNAQFFLPFNHPEEDLEAYALGALEPAEMLALEDHIQGCFYCSRLLVGLERATLALSQAVPQLAPPPALQTRLMAGLADLPPVFIPPNSAQEPKKIAVPFTISRFKFSRLVSSLAAILLIGLLFLSLIINVANSDRINALELEREATALRIVQLEQGRSTTGATLEQLTASSAQTQQVMKQLIDTDYLMARAATRPIRLHPAKEGIESEGLLLLTQDGRKAVIMLSNMEPPPPSSSYQVWLSRNGRKIPLGPVNVDSTGWGSLALNLPESLYGLDSINLTVEEPTRGAPGGDPAGEMVLHTKIISPLAR